MKKLVITTMTVLSVFGLTACGNTQTSDKKTTTTSGNTTTSVVTTTLPNAENSPVVTTTSTEEKPTDTQVTTTKSDNVVTTTVTPATTTTEVSTSTPKPATTTTVKKTNKVTTTTSLPQTNKEARLDVTPVKSKYYASASAFACVEMAADYFGYTAKQDDVIKHLIIDDEIYKKNGRTYIGDPDFKFIGDPSKKDAIGSTALPIQHAILEYFETNHINLEVIAPAKISFFRLKYAINEEKFLIMWIADDVEKCTDYYVKDDINDVVAIWPDNMTCMLLIAASEDSATFYDPATNKEITMTEEEYNKRACQYTLNIRKQTGL